MPLIRPELPDDRARVFEIQQAAFGREEEARTVDLLRAAASPQLSLVAEEDGALVGHIFFSPVTVEAPGAPPAGGLAPVAADPVHQKRGVGSALVRAGLARCPELGWRAVFLVGDPAYYSRFGFTLAAPRGFSYGDPVFDRALQWIELAPGALDGCRGRVRFHRAFADAGIG